MSVWLFVLSVAVGVVTDVVLELGDVQEGEAPVDGCVGRRTFCTILSLSAEKSYLVNLFPLEILTMHHTPSVPIYSKSKPHT